MLHRLQKVSQPAALFWQALCQARYTARTWLTCASPGTIDLLKTTTQENEMALKCPECGQVAHTRTSAYEAPSVKRTWYQCQNLDCSCTFTALESVEKIIMKPHRPAAAEPEPQNDEPVRQPQTLGRYGSASARKDRHAQP